MRASDSHPARRRQPARRLRRAERRRRGQRARFSGRTTPKRGEVVFALLNVNKPAGITSREVVNPVQRLVRPVKVGHAGTLDPLATGVLVLCLGQATRLIEYVQRMPKRYLGTFLLGRESDT